MRIGRLQITLNKPARKVERKLALEKFHTFKDGTQCFTYKVEDLARVSGRYLDQIKGTLNFMLQYAAGPEQVKAFSTNIEDRLKRALKEPSVQQKEELILQTLEISRQMPKLQDYVKDLHKKHWYDLYVMFFVLDGEEECMFSPKWNARKIELLEQEPEEVQELFFSFLEAAMIHFSSTYRQDLIDSIVQERELSELAASLTTLTTRLDMKSPSADTPEQTLNDTAT